MAISSVNNTSTLDVIFNTTNASGVDKTPSDAEKQKSDTDSSTVVTLSKQGQQLSRTAGAAPGQGGDTPAKTEAPRPQPAVAAPTIGQSFSAYA